MVFTYIRVAQIGTSCVRSTGKPDRTHVIPIPVGKGGFELRRTNISKPQFFSEVSIATEKRIQRRRRKSNRKIS